MQIADQVLPIWYGWVKMYVNNCTPVKVCKVILRESYTKHNYSGGNASEMSVLQRG